jgi:hypothetical protein
MSATPAGDMPRTRPGHWTYSGYVQTWIGTEGILTMGRSGAASLVQDPSSHLSCKELPRFVCALLGACRLEMLGGGQQVLPRRATIADCQISPAQQ